MTVGATESTPQSAGAIPFRFEPQGLLLVLSGPSGAGKGTLVDRIVEKRPECTFSISATTRPQRPNEEDGVQYEFVSREDPLVVGGSAYIRIHAR